MLRNWVVSSGEATSFISLVFAVVVVRAERPEPPTGN